MITMQYANIAWEKTAQLLAIDSPTGFTDTAAAWVQAQFADMGYSAAITEKGGVLVHLGGGDGNNGLMLAAHTDIPVLFFIRLKLSACRVLRFIKLFAAKHTHCPMGVIVRLPISVGAMTERGNNCT